jgi:NADP-dependent 3-hydroxy acid dehydrogenase YdfG
MQSVVITGATTGIGWATAKLLLDRGFRVFGSVRKQADADRLKSEFGANFTPLLFDVTDEAAVLAAAREGRKKRQPVDVGLFGVEARHRGAVRRPAP